MNKKITPIVGVVVIAVVIASLGCIGGGGSAKDIAKITPEGAGSLTYVDIQTMRDDRDLRDIYKDMKKSGTSEIDELGIDIDIDDINYIAEAGGITIIGGKFDLKDVRDELDDRDFDKDDYKGVEFWTGEYNKAVAIKGDKVIMGNDKQVKSCIKVIKGDRTSMYDDNEDIRDVINKLPGGIMTMVGAYASYEGALAMGSAFMKEDDDTLKMKMVVKFDDEDDAEDARTDLKREMKKGEAFDVDVKQSGKILEVTAKMDIEDWGEGYW